MRIADLSDLMLRPIRKLSQSMTFQAKLLLVFVTLLSIVMTVLAYIHFQSEKVLLRKSVANLRNMVNVVHYSTQSLSTQKPLGPKEVARFLRQITLKEGAIEASVIDFEHHVIASTNAARVGSSSPLPSDSIGVWGPSEIPDGRPDKVRYDVRIPLVRHKQVEGIVEVSVYLNDLGSYLWRAGWEQVLLFLAALVSAFAVFFLFLNRLHQPFRDMAIAAKKVSMGDFTVRLAGSDSGEEREMANSFNHMAKKLLEQRQLEERLFALERRAILSELGANLAHEIRNPLNLMNLTLHQLGKAYKPEEFSRQEPYLKLIASLKNEVRHLDGIVTEFLTLGRPSRISKKRFNLKELVSDIAIRLHEQIAVKKLRLDLQCPDDIELNADKEQMHLVLLNLMLNSIEMVPSGSAIEFSARSAEGSGEVACSISDRGPGIAAEDLDKVFDPYYTKRAGGMGLGLTLVRRIVEEHGGAIRAGNRAEGGAEFHFNVPTGV
jgi:signal transduction histidine kinase